MTRIVLAGGGLAALVTLICWAAVRTGARTLPTPTRLEFPPDVAKTVDRFKAIGEEAAKRGER